MFVAQSRQPLFGRNRRAVGTSSNNSKVIGSIEKKGLVERVIGTKDKRQMYFSLTPKGKELISSLKCEQIEIAPPLLELLERSGTAE